ncbi:hypothetical protein EG68_05256 [Paragonimus skrjabini miyazakii]|uniref:Uncharacterized protein n=1 Tax=Paragonimus skrjabini miyazakii TaxID=59628 RepID=A0A8S9YRS8_9TREM|nr:hypothetical protein EG68_05256 [Paragonimus skrjabini miyazakii]
MPLCKILLAKLFAINPMGDSPKESGLTDLPENVTTFFIGENVPTKEIPAHIRERLEAKKGPKLNYAERQKKRDLRMQEINDERKRKLHEHHEKVSRLVAQKKLKKQLQDERLAKDRMNTVSLDPSAISSSHDGNTRASG